MNNEVMAKIRQRRLQILVHSCIYYQYNANIITDAQWNSWAQELVQLQKSNPQESKVVDWARAFENFDGSTGMDLPIKDVWVMGKASQLLYYKNEALASENIRKEVSYYLPNQKSSTKITNTVKRKKLF